MFRYRSILLLGGTGCFSIDNFLAGVLELLGCSCFELRYVEEFCGYVDSGVFEQRVLGRRECLFVAVVVLGVHIL